MSGNTGLELVATLRSGHFEARRFDIDGPLLISTRRLADTRGFFTETYSRRHFAELGVAEEFVQENQSLTLCADTVRGLHFQLPPRAQAKLVRVIRGTILDVAVDLRRGSPDYGRHIAIELSADGDEMIYLPAGFAHGFVTREPETVVAYKVSDTYAPAHDRGLAWDDPALGIDWGLPPGAAVLSEKDRTWPRLADLGPVF